MQKLPYALAKRYANEKNTSKITHKKLSAKQINNIKNNKIQKQNIQKPINSPKQKFFQKNKPSNNKIIRHKTNTNKPKLTIEQKNIISVSASFCLLTILGWTLFFRANLPIYFPIITTFIFTASIKYYFYKKKSINLITTKKNNNFDPNKFLQKENIEKVKLTKKLQSKKGVSFLPKSIYLKNIQPVVNNKEINKQENTTQKNKSISEKLNDDLIDAIKLIKSSKKLPANRPFLSKTQSKKINGHLEKIEKHIVNE